MESPRPSQPKTPVLTPLRVIVTCAVWLVASLSYEGSSLHEYVESRITLPSLFQLRQAVGEAAKLDPKITILSYDDTTFAKMETPDLSTLQWAQLLRAVAKKNPKVIYVDKFFSRPPRPEDETPKALKMLRNLETPIVTAAFVTPRRIQYRDRLDLSAKSYQLRTLYENKRAMFTDGYIPMKHADGWFAYGPHERLQNAFHRPGHVLNAGEGKASALLDLGDGAMLPHMALMGPYEKKIDDHALTVGGHPIPLDAKGRMVVDFSRPGHYFERSQRLLPTLQRAFAGKPAESVSEGDVVLILPAMFTGNTDFAVTPVGPLPGPYVIASLINSLVRKEFIAPIPQSDLIALFSCILGAALVLWFGRTFWAWLFFVISIWAVSCFLVFSYADVLPDISTPAAAFLGTALTLAAQRNRLREKFMMFMKLLKSENEKLQSEIDQAEEVAQVFIPSKPPRWTGLDVGIYHRPLTGASGDWYAFETSPSQRFRHFLLCDITGHGVQAAIVVSTCKTVLSLTLRDEPGSLESETFFEGFMTRLNSVLYEQGAGFHLTTMTGITFDREEDCLHYVCAGHPPPVFWTGQPGKTPNIRPLLSVNSPLGVKTQISPKSKSQPFPPGSNLIVYSDGVPLPRNPGRMGPAIAALGEVSLSRASRELCQELWERERFKNGAVINDDISMVWFRNIKRAKRHTQAEKKSS